MYNNWIEIENNIEIENINKIYIQDKYLIEFCLIYRKLDIIKKILNIDINNFKYIKSNILYNILYDQDYITILSLLELLNDDGKQYILKYDEKYKISIIFFFITSKIKYIKEIIKYDKFIDWNILINNTTIICLFLYKFYNIKKKKINLIFDFILERNKDYIIKTDESIILKYCLKGYNKYILKKLYEIDNNIINKYWNNNIPITKSYNNNKLFNFLLKHNADYNFCEYDNNILINCIINNKKKKILKLLQFQDINVNIFNSLRYLPAHLMFIYKMPFKIKYLILFKTSDINFQDLQGNTVLHYLFYYDNWKLYYDILKSKNIDIFIKNNNNQSVFYLFNNNNYIDYDKFFLMIYKSCIYNLNLNFNNFKYIKKNKKYYLFKYIKKNINNIDKIKDKIIELEESTIKLDYDIKIKHFKNTKKYNINNKYIYTERDIDIYIYLLYYLKKYNFSIPYDQNNDNYLEKIIINYNKIDNLCVIPEKLDFFITNNKNNIIFILIKIISDNNNIFNSIIINKKNKNIIYFKSPFNNIFYNLDNILNKYFITAFNDYKFIKPFDYMYFNIYLDKKNDIEHGEIIYNYNNYIYNYSLLWNFWFLELYINNIHFDLPLLFNSSINYIFKKYISLISYIRKYSITLVIFMIRFLKKSHLSKTFFFKINFILHDHIKIINLINDNFKKIIKK